MAAPALPRGALIQRLTYPGRVPGDTGPLGPIPPGVDAEEYDRLRRRVLWAMPSGLYLIGSRAGDRANLMTANWVTQVASDPKLVGTGIEKGALTHELIAAGGSFTVCLLAREDRAVVRKFVKPAQWDPAASTLAGLPVRFAPSGAPLLGGAVAWLDCEVRADLDCGSHTWFVGEVLACGTQAAPEPRDTTPPGGTASGAQAPVGEVLRMQDTRMNYGG